MFNIKNIYSNPLIGFKSDSLQPAQIITLVLQSKLTDSDYKSILVAPDPICFIMTIDDIDTTMNILIAARDQLIKIGERAKAANLDFSDFFEDKELPDA